MKETKTVENYEDIRNAIFDFVYHEALNDATLQKAYEGETKKDDIEKKRKAKVAIKNYIDGILFEDKTQYSFEDTVQKVREAITDKDFTFGNIQKLINMTVKYFYISCYTNENLRKRFKNCHCPMDSIMIGKVTPKGHKHNALRSDTRWSKISDNAEKKKDTREAYDEFQKAISEKCREEKYKINISRIEFDYLEW